MLLLALTAQRVRSVHPEMARLTFQSDITRALQIGLGLLVHRAL